MFCFRERETDRHTETDRQREREEKRTDSKVGSIEHRPHPGGLGLGGAEVTPEGVEEDAGAEAHPVHQHGHHEGRHDDHPTPAPVRGRGGGGGPEWRLGRRAACVFTIGSVTLGGFEGHLQWRKKLLAVGKARMATFWPALGATICGCFLTHFRGNNLWLHSGPL